MSERVVMACVVLGSVVLALVAIGLRLHYRGRRRIRDRRGQLIDISLHDPRQDPPENKS